jgi:hypothetical protein
MPDVLDRYRILDLLATARSLAGGLTNSLPLAEVVRTYGIPAVIAENGLPVSCYQDLLWGVLAEAGKRGLDWPALLRFAEASLPSVSFARYDFDENTLETVPACPGISRFGNRVRDCARVVIEQCPEPGEFRDLEAFA